MTARQPFPQSIPTEDWTLVLGLFKGTKPDLAEGAHAFYDVLGFTLGKIVTEKVPMTSIANDGFDPMAYVEGMAKGQKFAGKINWAKLLQLLTTLLPVVLPFLNPSPANV